MTDELRWRAWAPFWAFGWLSGAAWAWSVAKDMNPLISCGITVLVLVFGLPQWVARKLAQRTGRERGRRSLRERVLEREGRDGR